MRKASSPGRAGPLLDCGPDVELAHLFKQCRAPYAETSRGIFDAVGAGERRADMLALSLIADLRERRKRGGTRRRGGGGKQRFDGDPLRRRERHRWRGGLGGKQRLDGYPWRQRERHGLLDTVAQLPHVA